MPWRCAHIPQLCLQRIMCPQLVLIAVLLLATTTRGVTLHARSGPTKGCFDRFVPALDPTGALGIDNFRGEAPVDLIRNVCDAVHAGPNARSETGRDGGTHRGRLYILWPLDLDVA